MKLVNVQEAKTHLSRLLDEAVAGQEIVIAKAGRPQVRLVPCVPDRSPRVLGVASWKGKGVVRIADDFDAPDARIIRMFEGDGAPSPSRTGTRSKTNSKRRRRRP